jgi:Ran GTPase-activating protein (RanGAP) involved in mRNA processing and transport
MTIKYNLGQWFMVSVLLISLFLQSCNQSSNPLIPIIEEAQGPGDDNQQLDSQDSLKEGEDKYLMTQGGNQKDIQTIQVDISIIDKEKKSHPIPDKSMQSEVIITKPFELATITPAYSQETGIQKYGNLTHLNLGTKQPKRVNQGELTQVDNKRKKTTQSQVSLHQGGLIGDVKKVVKTNQEPTKNRAILGYPLGKFDILPRDLLPGILSYLGSKELGQVRQLSKSFYKLTTGYERPGMVGVENKPSTNCLVLGLNTHTVDFKKVQKLTPETIPSFFFYRLIRQVDNLPQKFLPYLKGTSVHTVNLGSNQIGDSGAAELGKNLQGTSVHTIDLESNEIGDSGVAELAKNLQGTSVHTIDLSINEIGDSGAAEFAKSLQGTSVHTIDLSVNKIGASGAAELAKNLQGTSVHTVNLWDNKIGTSGAAELGKNLQGTSIHTIDLGDNEMGDSGAAELAKYLQGTSIHTVNLGGNQIGASGAAELAKNLQGTSVHTINLWGNEIGASGTAELAKNLQGTSVHTINLASNKIGDSGAEGFSKNLQGTSVHTVNLFDNDIGDSGAAEFAKNLQGTSVHTVNLGGNKISDSRTAEFAKNLQGTSVHTVDLSLNQIGDSGVVEFAKNLQGTNVHTIYLGGNQIGSKTQNLLKQQYTNIQWTF